MDEQLYIVMAKMLSGEATEAERTEMQQWIAADPARKAAYQEMSTLWQQADKQLANIPSFNTGAAWQKVAVATGIAAPVAAQQKKNIRLLPAWAKTSIGVAAACVIGLFIYQFFYAQHTITVVADSGNKEIVLPDQSHVTLHEGSSLQYPGRFAANERHVVLKGEAFFDVKRDEQHPFTIDAEGTGVKVLGTSFDVISGGKDGSVTVTTGKVQVTAANSKKTVILLPGEQGKIKNGDLTKGYVSSDSYLYWKTGVVNFQGQTVSSVIADIETITRASIKFDASVTDQAKQVKINVRYVAGESTDEVLRDINAITGFTFDKENNSYTIRAK